MIARNMGENIIALFHGSYSSIADFEQKHTGKTTGRHRSNANTAVGMAMNQNCLLGGLPDVTDF